MDETQPECLEVRANGLHYYELNNIEC